MNVEEVCSIKVCDSGLVAGTFDTSAGACGGRLQKKPQTTSVVEKLRLSW